MKNVFRYTKRQIKEINIQLEGGAVIIKKARVLDFYMLCFIILVMLCLIAGAVFFLMLSSNPTHKFLLPNGFTGTIEVTFEQSEFPALKKEGRSIIIYEVPPSGKISTSSKNISGQVVLTYVKQDGNLVEFPTNIPMIHGLHTSSGEKGGANGVIEKLPEKLTFFVGTEKQWLEAGKKQLSP
ncbi:hypothetical protein I6N90_17545 [Paenibacillus sp. GSMTC-2017]|uniref:DUF6843 domain-containing protein n=1 Tax=Paenibacillus sp. GSMTC-2017 TaxID=2794350 RepID=UPI0018DA1251|nr:hypothetical protein [Paenibacillus sp. GSMTC-2017]MBH5319604.1 hypothetical protein [Paenibacillus sp. GSMTC-2017]